ncbi:hypothetical protein ES288_A13G023500v1, partial [Gossypium darwinii]
GKLHQQPLNFGAPLLFCKPLHHCPLPLFPLFLIHHHSSHPQQSCHVQKNEPLCHCHLLKCFGFTHSFSSSFFLYKVLIYLFWNFLICFLQDHFDAELCNNWYLISAFTFLLVVIFKFVSVAMPFVNLKATILKGYPLEITLVSFYCLFGSIQSALVT